jgi:16S rRNA (cytosine1402-N4)-methyltransferase
MSEEQAVHAPVMVDRVTALLALTGSEPAVLVDATVGTAGHAAALLAASGPAVHLVGFDRDEDALVLARERLASYGERVTLVHAPYDELARHVTPVIERVGPLMGVLYDLGVSSLQLDLPERGFSFRMEGPLDMRMDRTTQVTAEQLVNESSVDELASMIRRWGEERFARRIAVAIVRARPLRTTTALAQVIERAVPAATWRAGHHPATRTFQALRIAVNAELDRFNASLPQALELTFLGGGTPPSAPAGAGQITPGRGGRIVVLSYHSLEDRIAKQFFSDAAAGCICPPDLPVCGCGRVPLVRHLTRGAQRPDTGEVASNPRARAARLRAVERITGGNALSLPEP